MLHISSHSMCVTTLCVWHDCAWCVRWLLHMCDSYHMCNIYHMCNLKSNYFMCVTLRRSLMTKLRHVWNRTPLYVTRCKQVLACPWEVVWRVTNLCVWLDCFICETRLLYMCHVTHMKESCHTHITASCVERDCESETWLFYMWHAANRSMLAPGKPFEE